jgi:hypothetical protein
MTAEQPLTLNDIAKSIAVIDRKITGLETKVDGLETKVDGLETTMNRRSYAVESRLADLETGQRHDPTLS